MNSFPILTLFLLAACGGSDPVPDADEAATGQAIEASVNEAQNRAVEAQLNATGEANASEAREQVAENLLSSDENRQEPAVQR
jgi:predicted small lipoprotein YifL